MQNVPDPMGPVLATRTMQWTRADGVVFPAYVDLGVPFEYADLAPNAAPAWACNVRTRGLGDDTIHTLYGVDAIQSLYLAMVVAATCVSNSIVAASLDWAQVPNYGFPTAPVIPPE